MQLLVYILVYPILWMISILPMRLLYIFSDLVFILVYQIIGYRKKTVRYNLDLVFPDKSSEEKDIITKKFYHHLCDIILESVKSLSISEAELKRRFKPTNIEEIKKLEKEGQSVVLMMAHYASWEWIFILQRYTSHKGNAIYKKLENKYFDALVKRIRAKYNTYLITNKEAIPMLVRAKEEKELTINGFISDQTPKHNKAHHWNEFMGIKVPIHTGAEMLAKKLDMPVVFCKVRKVKRGFYEATFATLAMNPKEYADYEITDVFMKLVEEQIHEAPEYYLWTHKRWKHKDRVPEKFQ